MALDLTTLSKQVRQMSHELAMKSNELTKRIEQVQQTYLHQAGNEAQLADMVYLNRGNSLLLARPVPNERLDKGYNVRPAAREYTLIATDGSQIDIDPHHGIARCYVINIGRVYLHYGDEPVARLSSQPALYYQEEDLFITDGAKRIAIEGNYLSVRRDVQELLSLEALSEEFLPHNKPDLALLDGTLMRWILAGAEKSVQERFLVPYLDCLDKMRARNIPIASYISRPRSDELIGTIRLMYCKEIDFATKQIARCHQCNATSSSDKPCRICDDLVDADIMYGLLSEGQRGPLFVSMSRINIESYHQHLVYFFYMRIGREVARVEIPQWVAEDPNTVDLVHSLVYDQCMRGQGYPIALARAHEQAVVRAGDRRAFQRIVEGSVLRAELPLATSVKQEKKEYTRT